MSGTFPTSGESTGNGFHLVVVRCVDRGKPGVLFRQLVQHENRIGGANRDASAAIDAFVRVNIQLRRIGETSLILLGVDAVHWAGLHTQLILSTRVRNYISHALAV